jgi:hypothetical protein
MVGESEGASEWKVAVDRELECVVVAPLGGRIRFQDRSFEESIGWRGLRLVLLCWRRYMWSLPFGWWLFGRLHLDANRFG